MQRPSATRTALTPQKGTTQQPTLAAIHWQATRGTRNFKSFIKLDKVSGFPTRCYHHSALLSRPGPSSKQRDYWSHRKFNRDWTMLNFTESLYNGAEAMAQLHPLVDFYRCIPHSNATYVLIVLCRPSIVMANSVESARVICYNLQSLSLRDNQMEIALRLA